MDAVVVSYCTQQQRLTTSVLSSGAPSLLRPIRKLKIKFALFLYTLRNHFCALLLELLAFCSMGRFICVLVSLVCGLSVCVSSRHNPFDSKEVTQQSQHRTARDRTQLFARAGYAHPCSDQHRADRAVWRWRRCG